MIAGTKYHKPLKFLATGGMAAATEYGSFSLLVLLVPSMLLLENVISFLLGLCVSFALNRSWVFASRSQTKRKFTKYFVLAMVNLVISTSLLYITTHSFAIPTLVAKLAIMVAIALWNYVIFSKLIFTE